MPKGDNPTDGKATFRKVLSFGLWPCSSFENATSLAGAFALRLLPHPSLSTVPENRQHLHDEHHNVQICELGCRCKKVQKDEDYFPRIATALLSRP